MVVEAVHGPFSKLPSEVAKVLERRGFTELTEVQDAVLADGIAGRDLRISSETGSGKTVALGFVLSPVLDEPCPRNGREAAPRALVIVPTRELAAQVARELSWLFAAMRLRVGVVTGGTNIYRDSRELNANTEVLVGTPGRLLDHIRRGSLTLTRIGAVVLDEADEMLDMGFRDDLEAILSETPAERQTHLVSATLPREVLRLANRYQRDPVTVQGTAPGVANENISHIAHLVYDRDRVDALINILLANPDSRTLVFVRTRAATTEVAGALASAGFAATPLSGEMGQRERNAALDAFRRGQVRVVVATDVAARGLDIKDVTRIVHFDLSDSPDGYTHRSGRTGRAGETGVSIALVTPRRERFAVAIAERAGVRLHWNPVPSPAEINKVAERRFMESLDARLESAEPNARLTELAQAALADRDPLVVVAELMAGALELGPCAPRELRPPSTKPSAKPSKRGPSRGESRRDSRPSPRGDRDAHHAQKGDYVPFFVSWGRAVGANPARLLAMVCRRGGVTSESIGAIRIEANRSVVEVADHKAEAFARSASKRDTRNPNVKIARWRDATTPTS